MIIATDVALNARYVNSEPQMFRVGDIVLAQVSFIIIPMKSGLRKMNCLVFSSVVRWEPQHGMGPLNNR